MDVEIRQFDLAAKRRELRETIAEWLCPQICYCSFQQVKGKLGEPMVYMSVDTLLHAIAPLVQFVDESAELPTLPVVPEKGFECLHDWNMRKLGYTMAKRLMNKLGWHKTVPVE